MKRNLWNKNLIRSAFHLPVYSYRYDVVNGCQACEDYEDEAHQTRPLDRAKVIVQVEDQVVGQRQPHHQVRDGEVEYELVGHERGQAPAHGDRQDGQRVAAHDQQHQRAVHDAPAPVVVEVRTLPFLGRVPPPVAIIPEYNVHTIAGRGRQRPPVRVVRRRGSWHTHAHMLLTVPLARHSRYTRYFHRGLFPFALVAHFICTILLIPSTWNKV